MVCPSPNGTNSGSWRSEKGTAVSQTLSCNCLSAAKTAMEVWRHRRTSGFHADLYPREAETISGEAAKGRTNRFLSMAKLCRPEGHNVPAILGGVSDVSGTFSCSNLCMIGTQTSAGMQNLEQYREFFDNAVIGMFRTTPEGRFTAANQALAEMLGYENPDQLLAQSTDVGSQIFVDSDERVAVVARADRQKSVQATESLRRRRDGTTFWASIRWRVSLNSDGSPRYFEGTIEDISDRKKQDAELLLAVEKKKKVSPPSVSTTTDSTRTAQADRMEATLRRIASELALIGMDGTFQVERLAPSELEGFKSLTRRESEVLRAIVTGDRVQTIAKTLNLAPNTVRNHLKAIFIKLGVRSQVELVEKLKKRA